MNFDNPVYRKTTADEESLSIDRQQYQPVHASVHIPRNQSPVGWLFYQSCRVTPLWACLYAMISRVQTPPKFSGISPVAGIGLRLVALRYVICLHFCGWWAQWSIMWISRCRADSTVAITTASIATKFCSTIKTPKCSSSVVHWGQSVESTPVQYCIM